MTKPLVEDQEPFVLHPCPFCGEVDRLQVLREPVERVAWVWCAPCGCAGPTKDCTEDAVQAWNVRARVA